MKIEINGIIWDIFYVQSENEMLLKSNNTLSLGVTDINDKYIAINNKLHGKFARKVLIHEICHAVCMSYNIFMSLNDEERLCDFVASHGEEIFDIVNSIEKALMFQSA